MSGVVCCGLEEVQVLTAKDIFNILGKGIQQRKTAETLMNKNSSRYLRLSAAAAVVTLPRGPNQRPIALLTFLPPSKFERGFLL